MDFSSTSDSLSSHGRKMIVLLALSNVPFVVACEIRTRCKCCSCMTHRSRQHEEAGLNWRKKYHSSEGPEGIKRRGTTAARPFAHTERYLSERVLNTTPPFLTSMRGTARFAAGGQRRLARITESSRYPQLMQRVARPMQPVPSLRSSKVSRTSSPLQR